MKFEARVSHLRVELGKAGKGFVVGLKLREEAVDHLQVLLKPLVSLT